ncbi:MAG TPA: ornithine cyclodeaminase family protein [Anaerolineales bacterium]|nr:ornithine cyclodeaminase family protein [Anaerolineales bacterium]
MSILILTHAEVERLLPMEECIGVMTEAMKALANGQVHNPLRMVVRPPDAAGLMGLMPSYIGGANAAYGLKAVCVFPQNTAKGKDAHQGTVMLFSAETGELLALMNASAITAIRTAAVSGVATKLLAREDAGDLALLGSGVQAHTHIEAMACARPIRRCRVASRSFEHAQRFAAEMRARFAFPVEPAESAEAAVRGADLIVTATNAREPVLKREWISPGAHLNVVGSSIPSTREVDTATMAAASLFVDRRESTLNEAGDYLFAAKEGAIGPEHIRAEIGEVLVGAKPGRTSPDEITLFKSLGLAVEDLASAQYVFSKARQVEIGAWVEF